MWTPIDIVAHINDVCRSIGVKELVMIQNVRLQFKKMIMSTVDVSDGVENGFEQCHTTGAGFSNPNAS